MPFPTTVCSTPIGGIRARFTRLDECCIPVVGPCSTIVKKFISLTLTPDVEDATEFTQKLADDTLCVNESGCPQLKGFDLELTLCEYDPELLSMLIGADIYADSGGNPVGFFTREDFGECPSWALEVWARQPRTSCSTDPALSMPFIYNLFPCITSGALTSGFSFANEVNPIVISAKAKGSDGWGVGPYDVLPGVGNVPGPLLTPMVAEQPSLTVPTNVAPPAAMCGCVALP